MDSLSIRTAFSAGENCSYVSGSFINLKRCSPDISLPKSLFSGASRLQFNTLLRSIGRKSFRPSVVRAQKGQKHEYPWPDNIDPNWKSDHLLHLSSFKALAERPKPAPLPFEKPLMDLEKKILDVRQMAEETGLDFTDQITLLESKYQQAINDLYTHLTPIQRLSIARHPNRPTFLDHVLNITDKWIELHGDRAGYDDPSIVTGLGSIDGKTYMFIGQQKGRNTKENIQRNFGMPTPHGYRKALRMMRYADRHGFPIITFIDTPGAYADLKSEELGQGEAIARNLLEMFKLKVPIVTVVIGEGGSGGALAIGCSNKIFMLENAVFFVASPEACAAILWKTAKAAPKAAEKLRITATELMKIGVADGIIPEPLGGAHTDPTWTSQQIKLMVLKAMQEYESMDVDALLTHRHNKFRALGRFIEGEPVDPEIKRNMKKRDADVPEPMAEIETEIENLKKAALEANGKPPEAPTLSDEALEKLQQEVDNEMTDAFISMGLQEKLEALKLELSKSANPSDDEISNPVLRDKIDRLKQEFLQNLSRPGAYLSLKQKLQRLSEATRLQNFVESGEKLKSEINEKIQQEFKGKMEILAKAQKKVARGETLEENELEEIEKLKEEMEEKMESMGLEVMSWNRMLPTAPPELKETYNTTNELVNSEINRVVEAAGLRPKLDRLKEELATGSSPEEIEALVTEIKAEISAALDAEALMKKLEQVSDGATAIISDKVEEKVDGDNKVRQLNEIFGQQ